MISLDELEELRAVCSSARALTDGPLNLVHLSNLNLEANGQLIEIPEALLCLSGHQGYLTRLYLSQVVPKNGLNWQTETILGRSWNTWSWQGIPQSHRPAQILAQHLRALR
jgi:hypothetical protein